ncbi:MAG: hypothetical protein VKL59_05735 [Nostocaceae cyanobacterium]|nr:hypothetical protein [Nostocaceae cyanobacterium]
MIQKVTVFETNEIPLKLFKYYQSIKPKSAISYLLENSLVLETLAKDVDESFLYPSQTWASLNTGSPYELHKIHWYNDPKLEEYPLYWKTLQENGFSVGLVNTLHSSPASVYADDNNYKFIIPDCFAIDSFTKPNYYQPFQQLNIKVTSLNSRITTVKAPLQETLHTLLNFPKYGIRSKTVLYGINLISKILLKQINKERLRNLQFPLIADMFLNQLYKSNPDIAILFTNHVAANMHRYWYALFPDDYDAKVYDQDWVDKYSCEIIDSLAILDDYLKELIDYSKKQDRILVIVSSMGQNSNKKLPGGIQKLINHDFRLENVEKFVDKFTSNKYDYRIEAGMVPQYALEFINQQEAEKCFNEIKTSSNTLENINLKIDLNAHVITLTATLNPNADNYSIRNNSFTYSDLGFIKFNIEDHHSGCHCPEGSLIIFNSKTSSAKNQSINYLEYAPAMLNHFGITTADYMLKPSFTI